MARTLAAALTMAWAQLTAAQSSSVSTEYSLTISSGPLATAIDQFSTQTGLQMATDLTPEQQRHPVDAVTGRFTADAALDKLLAGTELTHAWLDDTTIRIFVGVVRPAGEGGQRAVLVTGSRLRGGESPAPVRIYGRQQIDRFGVSSLPGLATYFTQQPFSFGEWAQRSAAQHFQMRGLGVDTTLVLINGRRVPPSATSVSLNAFDLNTIPITAVERIEVMSDSASALYGSDAIGGVVNIILKQATAPEIYVEYGGAAGGADERRVAGSIGTSREQFRSSLTVDYFDRTMLIGAERDLWRDQDFRRFGGNDYRLTTAPRANIYSTTGLPLPGLSTLQASVPVGSTGIGLQVTDFLGTAGDVSRYSAEQVLSIVPDVRRLSAVGSVELSLNDSAVLFGEMLATRNDIVAQGFVSPIAGQIVPAENPYNPFGQPVRVNFSLAGTEPASIQTDSQTTRFVLGARGGLNSWDWEVALSNSDEKVDLARVNEVDLGRVQAALQSTDPMTALNPFADGPAGSDALLSSLMREPQKSAFFSRQLQFSTFLRGSLFRLPGGLSEVVVGGELRREEVRTVDTSTMDQERDITSEFAEVRLPVLKQLSFKLALRADFYERAKDSVNPQYGLVWHPRQGWLVRAAYGTSFRPPSLLELSSQRSEFQLPVVDPRRGGTVSNVAVTSGGNPDLENVSAHSFTGGVVYQPGEGPGLHGGAHYWRVVMDSRIVVPRTSDVGKLEGLEGRVTRYDPSVSDTLAGWPGAIKSLDVSLLNYGRLETSGIDLDVSYRVAGQWGHLRTGLSATWVDKYSFQDLSVLKPLDRVGIASQQGTIPEWRLVGSLEWEGREWGTSATVTYTPRYRDSDLTGVLARTLPSRTIVDVQAWLELHRLFDADLFNGLRLTAGALNAFDEDVDFANVGLTLGFDMTQADLKQRFAYLRVTKSF
ncbi:TonB-dependent receptor domain-containing protein [Steroidobacter flavus]|uniref:TonB-dependent receptor domain-containing protein n=1 Tax=Steroidobacter flavus TaxID=1842136 RepID=A0ABV8T4T7_9GAMM